MTDTTRRRWSGSHAASVTPVDAERLIYLTEFEKLYFDLVPNGEAPVKTPGEGPSGVLAV